MNYSPPKILFSPHLETIAPALFRKVTGVAYTRERIKTPDDDFLDLDWVFNDSEKLVIISHGLEGSSDRPYMKGMAKTFIQEGYDVLTWNFRGCSDEMNRQLRFYHSGATDDLHLVAEHALRKNYKAIYLVGFSLGGNLTLKYLGETSRPHIRAAVAFSVPLDLHTSCIQISKPSNFVYSRRFLKNLKDKIRRKAQLMPGHIETKELATIKDIMAFDDRYTAPMHGFDGAVDYYKKCSSINYLDTINTPTLIVNAKNDPFLSPECYPTKTLKSHQHITFESPDRGGHVGFSLYGGQRRYWSEQRAVDFVASH